MYNNTNRHTERQTDSGIEDFVHYVRWHSFEVLKLFLTCISLHHKWQHFSLLSFYAFRFFRYTTLSSAWPHFWAHRISTHLHFIVSLLTHCLATICFLLCELLLIIFGLCVCLEYEHNLQLGAY